MLIASKLINAKCIKQECIFNTEARFSSDLKMERQVGLVSEVLLMEYLAERTLNFHRVFSDIPSDSTVDFQVEFRSMLSGRAMKAQALSKSSGAAQESSNCACKAFSRRFVLEAFDVNA